MGVTGLLPFLQKASRPAKMREFAGTTIAVDIYVWLHKGAFSCAEALAQGRPTDAYVKYVMRWCDMLLHHKIKPILVFDGRNLPSKALTEKKRRAKRKENREKAMHLLREGRRDEAFKYFQTSIDITPEMARNVIAAARERNIDCIVAPYEADAQLAYLNMCGLIDYIITEDSDLCLFGCQKVLFKLKETGDCILYDRSELGKVFGNAAVTFNFDKFRYMCIMSGCDYLESLPGIGLAKAMKFWQKASNPDLNTVLKKIPTYLNMNNLIVSQEYIKGFIQANRTLLHQIVYDPVQRSETYLTPLTQDLKDDLEHSTDILNYCGSFSHPDIALQLALGNLDLHTLAPITHFNPDDTLKTVVEKPKYGYRTTHPSIWRPEGQKTGMITTSSTEQIRISAVKEQKPEPPPFKADRKRLPEKKVLVNEESITSLLEKEEQTPPPKRLKLSLPTGAKLTKMVGQIGEAGEEERVSSYFAKSNSDDSATKAKTSPEVAPGRNSVPKENGGSWFKDLEKSSSAEGKFIYRPELSDLTNHVESVKLESRTETPRRNPFKVVAKKQDIKDAEVNADEVDLIEEKKGEERVDSGIGSSQLSIYSIDADSLHFSQSSIQDSQGNLKSSQISCNREVICISSQDMEKEGQEMDTVDSQGDVISISSQESNALPSTPTSGIRLGLSKFTSSQKKPVVTSSLLNSSKPAVKQAALGLGKARVSGLSRPPKKTPSLHQPSLLSIFSRVPKKANLGPSQDAKTE